MADAVANAPWYITGTPFAFILDWSIVNPFFPSTYSIVFTVSIGVKAIRKIPAMIDPPAALTITGNFLVDS